MGLQRRTWARLTTAGVLLLTLAAGVVLGIAFDRRTEAGTVADGRPRRDTGETGTDGRGRGFDFRSRGPSQDSSQTGRSSQRGPSLIVEQVGLSERQEAQVDSIVRYFGNEMRNLHEEFDEAYSTRYRELNRQVREEVRSILTLEQQMLYDSIRGEWERRRQERRQDSVSSRGAGGSGNDAISNER